ncbi:MAG: exodeoxyribonuclease III, partial [Verrucomicrobiota bacterium]
MKLVSWNVNGLRAVLKKDFLKFVKAENPDLLCLQEIKALPTDVDLASLLPDYQTFWNPADKKGYSGTLILTKNKPLSHANGIGIAKHDTEGRVVTLEYKDFYVVTVYTPNAQHELARIDYRKLWDKAFLKYVRSLEKSKPVAFGGDLNVAHKEIDLARPKENQNNPGFSPEERAGFDRIAKAGFIDTFREFESGPNHYSWWSYRAGARARNVGWRIDYWCIS